MTVAPVLLALDVAASLVASGVVATTHVTPAGQVELLVMLDPAVGTMGVLDIRDLTAVLVDEPGGAPRTVNGPHAPGTQACDDPGCLTPAIWSWVLRWRGSDW